MDGHIHAVRSEATVYLRYNVVRIGKLAYELVRGRVGAKKAGLYRIAAELVGKRRSCDHRSGA